MRKKEVENKELKNSRKEGMEMWNHSEWDESEWDEKIREELRRTAEPLPESYERRIKEIYNQLPDSEEDEKNTFGKIFFGRMPRVAAIVVVAVMFMITPAAVAGVKVYISHLSEMNPEQMEDIHTGIQVSQGEADKYSRPLSQTEQGRITVLREQYKDGTCFPQAELSQVKTEDERIAGEFCYCVSSNTFYLPEQEMSEEQLRQIVDFQYRRDYVLKKAQESPDAKIAENEPKEELAGDKETALREKSSKLLGALYDIDTNGADCEVSTDKRDATITYKNEDWTFDVETRFALEDMKLLTVTMDEKEKDEYMDGIVVHEKEYQEYGVHVREMAEKLVSADEIEKLMLGYYKEDGKLWYGVTQYYILCKNGNGYRFSYSMNSQQIYSISYVPDIEEAIKAEKEKKQSMKEMGVIQKWVVLQK